MDATRLAWGQAAAQRLAVNRNQHALADFRLLLEKLAHHPLQLAHIDRLTQHPPIGIVTR